MNVVFFLAFAIVLFLVAVRVGLALAPRITAWDDARVRGDEAADGLAPPLGAWSAAGGFDNGEPARAGDGGETADGFDPHGGFDGGGDFDGGAGGSFDAGDSGGDGGGGDGGGGSD